MDMKLDELMGIVIDELYAGLTGGDAELPVPQDTMINWLMPAMVLHESEFDFAIAGPFAGPSPLTLPFFKTLVETIVGDNAGMDRAQAIDQAKAMYQSHLLGTWENWSRIVDFIPLQNPNPETSRWKRERDPGAKHKHTQIVYAQAGRTLSQTYADTLNNCEVADDELTENEKKIIEITSKATPSMLWQGAFSQLSNSKVEANFADQRTYVYNKEPIDTAYHLGYDLSVTKNYPVEAANSGNAVFAGELGIYGNTVILDHGLGLFTLYSHLSSIDVKAGDAVKQRQILGKTGETGLAAGDHLHFGVYLAGVAVLPVEWWDAKWIRDNIEPKLEGRGGQEIAEAQQGGKSRKPRRR